MYDGCTTSVRTLIGSTESFEVKVGIHQGSALSPLLFITVMDVISKEVGRGPLRAMLFADDLVLCENTREEAEEQLALWRNAIENKGLRASRRCETERKTNITIHGHHQERHKKEWADGRQHSRSEIELSNVFS